MKQQTIFWVVLLTFVLLIGGAYLLYTQLGLQAQPPQLATDATPTTQATTQSSTESATDLPPETSAPKPELTLAPDFTVYAPDGSPMRLSDLFGKPIVLNFWASWCGPCKNEMPDFQALYEIYKDDIHFVMVNMTDGTRETQNTAATFIQESGYTFPVYFDLDSQADQTYQVYSLPTTYIIDRDGFLVARGMGTLSKEALQGGIDMVYP